MSKSRRYTHAEKRAWVFARLRTKWEHSCAVCDPPSRPFICAMVPEDQEAWQVAFGGKTHIYTVGPNVSPAFARTLRRMWLEGDLRRAVSGNQEARFYAQKTYCLSYTFAEWPLGSAED